MLLALKIERELSKDEILELYFNVVPFGKRAYGVQAAAYTYYGKSLTELDLPQFAMLAGIPQAPSAGNPINGPERALKRRNTVLGLMLNQNSITRAEYEQALQSPITALVHERGLAVEAPYAAEWVRQQLLERFGSEIYSRGYEVTTTIEPRLQRAATLAVRKGLELYDRRHGYRGAEAHLDPVIAPREPQNSEDSSDGFPAFRSQIAQALEAFPERGGLEAALVGDVEEKAFSALRANGEVITVGWEGMSWARPYVDTNSRGPAPKQAADIVQAGDVIRIAPAETGWRLTQLPEVQGALVSLDPDDGSVRAMVGGFDFATNQFNHATQSARQPGSGFKPFVYAAALDHGITPSTVFMDAPLVFNDENLESIYRPKNDGGRYNGPTRLREALYRSINLVSMRVLLKVGAGNVLDYVRRFGFDVSNFPRNTQLAIGGGTIAITPLRMASAYSIFANGGYRIEPHIVTEVHTLDGEVSYQAHYPTVCDPCDVTESTADIPQEPSTLEDLLNAQAGARQNTSEEMVIPAERVVDENTVFIMNTMLRDVIRRGTGIRARALGRSDLAGKTGTTNEADTWFNGFQRELATTVWVGFSDHRPLGDREYGSNTPLPIWIDFMRVAMEGVPEVNLKQPQGVVSLKIDPQTGEIAAPGQSNAIFEYFLKGHVPKRKQKTLRLPEHSDTEVRPEDIF